MSKQMSPVESGSNAPDNVTFIEDWLETRTQTIDFDKQAVRLSGHALETNDGSRYDVHVFEPEYTRYDTAIAFTTAWFTDLDGFNDRLGVSLAKRGMTAILVSPERLSLNSIRHLSSFGQLRHDASAMLEILDELEKPEHDLQIESGQTILAGYSRGSMVGLGVNEMAGQAGRRIPYNYLVDPCLEHAAAMSDVESEGPARYIGKELCSLAKTLGHSGLQEWGDIPKTVSGTLRNFAGNIAVMPHLFSGEAGHFNPPQDMLAHIRMYLGSSLNHHKSWQERFAGFPNVKISTSDGSHLTGSDPLVRQQTADDIQRVQELLLDNASPKEILLAVG